MTSGEKHVLVLLIFQALEYLFIEKLDLERARLLEYLLTRQLKESTDRNFPQHTNNQKF